MKTNTFQEVRNTQQLSARIKKDLVWVLFSVAAAVVAAAGTYMIITKPA